MNIKITGKDLKATEAIKITLTLKQIEYKNILRMKS